MLIASFKRAYTSELPLKISAAKRINTIAIWLFKLLFWRKTNFHLAKLSKLVIRGNSIRFRDQKNHKISPYEKNKMVYAENSIGTTLNILNYQITSLITCHSFCSFNLKTNTSHDFKISTRGQSTNKTCD